MARRRRRKSRKIQLHRSAIARIFTGAGFLYFFARVLAADSPLILFFQRYSATLVGQNGVDIFFFRALIFGIAIFRRPRRAKFRIKQFAIANIISSALLNFPILETNFLNPESAGGYLSRPIFRGLDQIFGGEILASKILVILAGLGRLGFLIRDLGRAKHVPRIERQSVKPPKKSDKKTEKKSRKNSDDESSPKKSHKKNAENFYGDEIETPREFPDPDATDAAVRKNLFKQKVEQKLQAQRRPAPKMYFSSDKPTFSTDLLLKNLDAAKIDENFVREKARALQRKLAEFEIKVSVEWFDIGPSILQIKIRPEAGVKIARIENLKNDIASSLKTKSLRLVAPIPGTDLVGIQIPNPQPQMVRLGDILTDSNFYDEMKKNQTNLTLGRAIDGSVITKKLESMPHLLVAGATGSGKSVGVNDFILSLMFQNTPAELKFLMVDPKQVELEFYSNLPYLLAPIVTDPDKGLRLLRRSVDEMERRYAILKEKRVKNLDEFNQKMITEKMFRIVIVVDELADLMMAGNKKEVEACITRIAQKARAVGMHLIIATQRPQVSVITGLIKANMPTRIAFGVVSEVDSRTILGRQGAEMLLGRGDLLYIDPTTKFPIRVQAPFVDTPEIEKITAALEQKYLPDGASNETLFDQELMSVLDGQSSGPNSGYSGTVSALDGDDALIEQAIEIIRETRKASATLLQRRLNIGFARASRVLDTLEERGVIGPVDGAKPRDIFL